MMTTCTSWLVRAALVWMFVVGLSVGSSLRRHRRSIDENQRNQILSLHNTLRRQEGASNMAALSWDADLAGQADCTAPVSAPAAALAAALAVTFGEQKAAYNHTQLTCDIASCNIYLQVVWASATKVGCNTVTCDGGLNVVCLYDVSVDTSVAPYMTGTACADCPTDSQCTEGLCSAPPTTTATTTTGTTTTEATATTTTTTPTTITTTTTVTTEPTTTADPVTIAVTTDEEVTNDTTDDSMTTAETTEPSTPSPDTQTIEPTTTADPVTIAVTTDEEVTNDTTDDSMTTAETTEPSTPSPDTQTIVAPGKGVHVLLTSPQVVRNNRAAVERTLRQESAKILNLYCCQHPAACCGMSGGDVSDVNITDCEIKGFINESGIRLGKDSPVDRTVGDVDVLVYQLVAVIHVDNAICRQVKQAQAARRRRAVDDDETLMLVPRNVLQAALETSESDLSESLSKLGIEVSIELDLPQDTESEAPMVPVWGWALVGVGALIVLALFVIIGMICMKNKSSNDDDQDSSDASLRSDSKQRLFTRQQQQKRDSGQSGNSGSSVEGVAALRYSSKLPWGNGHQGGRELRAPIQNYPMDGNREPYKPRDQRYQGEPQYRPDVGYPRGRPGNNDYRRNWGGESSLGDNIGQGIFPQFYSASHQE